MPDYEPLPPEFASALVQEIRDGVFGFDGAFRFTVWNPELERLSGLSRAEVIGRNVFEMFPFLIETGEDACFRRALAGESPVSRNRPFDIPATGRSGRLDIFYFPVRDAGGMVTGGMAIARDVTPVREAYDALRVSEARFEAVFGGSTMGVALVDMEGKALLTNAALQAMLGYSDEWDPLESTCRHASLSIL